MPKGNFISQLMAVYPKIRPFIAMILVVAVSVSPVIPNPGYKIAVTSALSLTLLFLAFDIYRELLSRLSAIERHLKEPEPPTYKNFTEALPTMEDAIVARLNANENVLIRILAVTSQFSWKHLVEDRIDQFLELGNRKQIVSIELAIVKPEILEKWQQETLMLDARRTLSGIDKFRDKYAEAIKQGRVSLLVYQYDNIPHWHGVLIDDDTLFLGRARWSIHGSKTELTVGQNTYRKFQRNDRFRGTDRVVMFVNWLEAYKLRDQHLRDSKML